MAATMGAANSVHSDPSDFVTVTNVGPKKTLSTPSISRIGEASGDTSMGSAAALGTGASVDVGGWFDVGASTGVETDPACEPDKLPKEADDTTSATAWLSTHLMLFGLGVRSACMRKPRSMPKE